jgi:peptide/nickel transport system ATP-binding protein
MEHGQIVEQGTADQAILNPQSEYTKRLLGDVPKIYEPWDFSAG